MDLKSYFAERAIRKHLDKNFRMVGLAGLTEECGNYFTTFLGQSRIDGMIVRAGIGYDPQDKKIITYPSSTFGPIPNGVSNK